MPGLDHADKQAASLWTERVSELSEGRRCRGQASSPQALVLQLLYFNGVNVTCGNLAGYKEHTLLRVLQVDSL